MPAVDPPEDDDDLPAAGPLPAVLGPKGTIQVRLDGAARTADDQGGKVAWLQSALGKLREECEGRRSAAPPVRADDGRWALWLGRRPAGETGPGALLRLIALLTLTDSPSPAVFRAGLEAYRADRADYDHILGEAVPEDLRLRAMDDDYATNANPTAAEDWPVFAMTIRGQREDALPGLATGLAPFDRLTGGLNDLALLTGEPGCGKSTLALQVAVGALKAAADLAVLYVDTEMGKDAVYRRMISHESGVPLRRVVAPDRDAAESAAVRAANERLQGTILGRIKVVDRSAHGRDEPLTPDWFVGESDALLARTGMGRCLVVVDSLNKMAVGDFVDSFDDRGTRFQRPSELEASKARMDVLLALQRLSRRRHGVAGLPILAVARCRKKEGRSRLEVADVLGGADIGYEAQAVYILEARPAADAPVTPVTLTVAKNRDWGTQGEIELDFHHTVSVFKPAATPAHPPHEPTVQPRSAKGKRFRGKS